MILNTEPGGYCPCIARFRSGRAGSCTSASHVVAVERSPMNRSTAKAGCEAMASTSPLRGSMTTTAPARAPIARSAASWIRRSTVVTTWRAGQRLLPVEDADQPPVGVDLDALAAVAAAQVLVEQPLEPGLPDHVAAAGSARPRSWSARLAHVAQEVGGEATARIGPLRLDLDDHARQLEPPLLDLGDLVQREPAAQPHRPR